MKGLVKVHKATSFGYICGKDTKYQGSESWHEVTCDKCLKQWRWRTKPIVTHDSRLGKPIDLKILKIALDYDNYKMLEIGSLTVKAWRVLKRIRAIDKSFLPMTEHDVWRQSTRMGLDA